MAVGSAAAFTQAGWSLGLGDISLNSYLNEPLRAELVLLETDGLNVEDIRLGLASEQEFARLGVERAQFLTKLVFDVQGDGAAIRAVLTTELPLREPYLNFLVEARWPEGRLLREYTLLIDLPPRETERETSAAIGAAPEAMLPAENPSRYVDRDADNEIRPGGSYLVRNSDTLWRITAASKPLDATMEQAMLSIVLANPDAFDRGNINGLKSGYVLSLPTVEEIVISPQDAKEEVARQNAVWIDPDLETAPGLTLVADPIPAPDRALPAEVLEVAMRPSTLDEVEGAGEATVNQAAPGLNLASSPEFDALMNKVEVLERNLLRLEQQLDQRDAELAALRTQLLAATSRSEQPAVNKRQPTEVLPNWVLLAGTGLLISGALAGWWGHRRRTISRSDSTRVMGEATKPEAPPVAYPIDAPSDSRMPAEVVFESGETDDFLSRDATTAASTAPGEVISEPFVARVDPPGVIPSDTHAVSSSDLETDVSSEKTPVGEPQALEGLSLVPMPDVAEAASMAQGEDAASSESSAAEESIYGAETDPVDSKLDLARAYIDMGDEEGARSVLAEVMREGDLSQQAEAQELLLRL